MKRVLSIAGSDSSGGAGIQADIKAITAGGAYAMTAITALTAQNTTGVRGIFETTPAFLESQIEAVFDDIFPDAVKVGMVSSAPLVEVIGRTLARYGAKNIVVDPVMVATSGADLIRSDAVDALARALFPLAAMITPNLPEAEVLCGHPIPTEEARADAAVQLGKNYGTAVLLKGGHPLPETPNAADDLLWDGKTLVRLPGVRVDTPNTHGTGCTLSSAIATCLAFGFSPVEAVRRAKAYVAGALAAGKDLALGQGSGPLPHTYALSGFYTFPAPIG